MFVSYEPIPTAQWGDKQTKRTQANGRNSKQNTKYPKLTRLVGNLLDENKAESERTEETSETRVGTDATRKLIHIPTIKREHGTDCATRLRQELRTQSEP